ncbi:coiled-coil domain-containing protein [Candidatus Phytoplasma meliae]|uniref:Chromosome partition protein Smc n=1 Tax=Candidatus Phytoplasma meliae TaxID=1848402 RepID=A0ABS5CXS2_9MOLU|nr:hypothetical protein [Candidatus Phytoplasma meliae]MBP5835770.1 hypothetical protein [Candidatus Phytoplasma meliae]MBP5836219.1 hypothetical protein [Candidatus Phytoplasma meliae]
MKLPNIRRLKKKLPGVNIIPTIIIFSILITFIVLIFWGVISQHQETIQQAEIKNIDVEAEATKLVNERFEKIREIDTKREKIERESVEELTDVFHKTDDELKAQRKLITDKILKLEELGREKDSLINGLNTTIDQLQKSKSKEAQDDINNLRKQLQELETTKNKVIDDLKTQLNTLEQNITTKQNEINSLNTTIPKPYKEYKLSLEPYYTYKDKEGNTIREYRLFDKMHPTQKDIKGNPNFLERKDFESIMSKYGLQVYPIKWTNGKENLYNCEYDSDMTVKEHYGWRVSKANYQLIQTNQPNNTTELLTKDKYGDNGFWNKSNCFLNGITNIQIDQVLNSNIKNKTPYIRLMTKNLELEFDWLNFICTHFKNKLPKTADAQERIADAQEHARWVQEWTMRAQEWTTDKYYTEMAQECTTMVRRQITKANQLIQQAKANNEPTFNIISKQVTKRVYDYNNPQTFTEYDTSYNTQEWNNWLKGLNLQPNDPLYTIREFILYHTDNDPQTTHVGQVNYDLPTGH